MTRTLTLGLFVALLLACAGPKDTTDNAADDSSPTSDDSTSDDSTADDSSGDDTSLGEEFERTDPLFTVQFAGSTWSSATGYYTGGQGGSFINATGGDSSRSQTVTIQVDGNLRYAGEYAVGSIHYTEGPAQAGVDVDYGNDNPVGVTFVVEGFAEERYLFGHMTGNATLTDSFSGGTAEWTELTLVSWPRF